MSRIGGTTQDRRPTPFGELLREGEPVPRLRLGVEPTPLVRAPHLERAIGGASPTILIKMDSDTGFALGGNKVRKLEYELAPDRISGATCLITTGGIQSNHARVTAAAAARLGLDCVLVLNGTAPDPPTGNALLHRLFGAKVEMVPDRSARSPRAQEIAQRIAADGGGAVVIPLGASTPHGALGYVRAALEFERQRRTHGYTNTDADAIVWIFVPSSSGGTLGGLRLGMALAGAEHVRLVGVSADASSDELRTVADDLAHRAAELLGWSGTLPAHALEVTDEYVGEGYGIPTAEADEAMRLFAHHAGVILDPVYTTKAAAGLIDWVRSGRVAPKDVVVFWHTGGHPALFV